VPGARVGSSLAFAPVIEQVKVQIGYGAAPAITDARGAFSVPAAPIAYTHVLVAAGLDGTLGFAAREDSAPTRIVLRAPARLKLEIVKRFGHQHPFSIDLIAAGSAVGYGSVPGGSAQLVVPQGTLELTGVGDPESLTVRQPLVLSAQEPSSIHLELQPTVWARNLGKAAPSFTATDVQNWSGRRAFASPRGKWVLVTFWATWCLPCVQEMPKLIAFYERNARLRAQFEIIAVHSPDGASLAAIQPQYERLVKAWKGKSIPFPLLFDSSGETHKRWGIEAYPTNILVDREGRIAGAGGLDELASRIGATGSL